MTNSDLIAQHRSRMRKGVLKVFGTLYVLVKLYQGWQYTSLSRLAKNHQMTEARITRSYEYSRNSRNGFKSDYAFSVDGKSYGGTMESGGIQAEGTKLNVFYEPGSPSNHCLMEPVAAVASAGAGLGFLTFGYGFMITLGLILVSLTKPPGLTAAHEPGGEPGLTPQ